MNIPDPDSQSTLGDGGGRSSSPGSCRGRVEKAEIEALREIAGRVDQIFWMTTADRGRVLYMSPAYETVMGRSRAELEEDPLAWLEAVHPDDRKRVESELTHRGQEEHELDYRIVRPDGEVRHLHGRVFPIQDGEGSVGRIVGVATDVTARRRAEEELRTTEEGYRSLVEKSGDVIGILDRDLVTRYVSPSVRRILGYEPEELVGTQGKSRIHPEDREMVLEKLEYVAERPGEWLRWTERMLHRDGSVRHVESVATNLLHVPAVQGIVVDIRDVTDRVELEEQLRRSQTMEVVGKLAGGVVHDFNNILTVIEGRADFLLSDLPESDPVREHAAEIRQVAQRATALTRQLLSVTKGQVFRPRSVDLTVAVEEMRGLLSRVLGEDVELVVDGESDPLCVRVDPVQFEQVVLNLVLNGKEAMPGGGRITVSALRDVGPGPSHVHGPEDARTDPVDDASEPRFHALRISDEGEGIPDELREEIFEPFFTTKEEGTGLGLSTTHRIVTRFGGGIEVESAPGEGTTFTVRLPAADRPSASERVARPKASDVPPGRGERLLVVEDDAAIRKVVRRTLERYGYRVHTAADGEEAIAALDGRSSAPDLALIDVVLPRGDGLEVARSVVSRAPDTPILFMSGWSDDEVSARLDGERIAFVAKPFPPDELARRVHQMLNGGDEPVGGRGCDERGAKEVSLG